MKILYYDCFSGISGDMNMGALIDLGVKRETLVNDLKKLNLEGWKLEIKKDQRHGITGTRADVITEHSDDHHHHDHHRSLSDIENLIISSSLNSDVKDLALRIFNILGQAEAHVHNIPVSQVHFHEVGAVDSIIDIVGAAICFRALNIDKVYVSTIELGSGIAHCEHGMLPVPAPATAQLVSGFSVHTGGVDFEATTPTGAAILASLAEPVPEGLSFVIRKTGYGIGHKDNPGKPNILRVFMAEADEAVTSGHQAYMVECNIDDMIPELSDYLSAKLFSAGARDVFFTPVVMKKGRPAFTVSIICEKENLDQIKMILFTESTTIGLRVMAFEKETLRREFEEINTRFGKVLIKKSYYHDKLVSVKPESSRCAEIAAETGIPMKQVIQEIMSLIGK